MAKRGNGLTKKESDFMKNLGKPMSIVAGLGLAYGGEYAAHIFFGALVLCFVISFAYVGYHGFMKGWKGEDYCE